MLLRDSANDERLRRPAATRRPHTGVRLESRLVALYLRQIDEMDTRKELDALTRRVWEMYDNGWNDAELGELKQHILNRRAMLAVKNPR
jgi:hypothetical protein